MIITGAIAALLATGIFAGAGSAAQCEESLSVVRNTNSVYSYDSVDALSPDDVWTTGESEQAEFAHWDGESWSEIVGPHPEEGEYQLHAVAGSSSDDVWAVGEKSASPGAAILHWDGESWSPFPFPDIGRNADLMDVHAFPDGTAYAVEPSKRTIARAPVLSSSITTERYGRRRPCR